MNQLSIDRVFSNYARDLINSREDAITIHHTKDIKAAGNEVEQSVRDFFQRVLPKKFCITHGHLIDINGNVSPQIDLIISDNTTMPSFIKAKDDTEYIPIDSVYAIAEIKSTYDKSSKPIEEFSYKLKFINTQMQHPLITNTAFGGIINDDLDFAQIGLVNYNKKLNRIFSFIFFVNHGDFKFRDMTTYYANTPKAELPDISIFLDTGIVAYTYLDSSKFEFHRYPEEHAENLNKWRFFPFISTSSENTIEGNILGFIYNTLLSHLSQSFLDPPSFTNYASRMFRIRKSEIET